ncbi:MAG: M6 family metalloprotease domain-containing protein [Rikenellaceae bacterium]
MLTNFFTKIASVLLLVAMLFAFAVKSYAMPASPKLIKAQQQDGSTLTVRIFGDEHFNWRTTEEGYPVVEKEGFYYYANYKATGEYTISNQRVMVDGKKINPTSSIQKVDMSQIAATAATAQRAKVAAAKTSLNTSSFPNSGDVRSIVILVEYYDVKFTVDDPNQAFNNQLNQEGYSVEGAVGSARDYFYENSGGQFNGQFDVYGPYELSQPQRYYGGNSTSGGDLRPQEMIEEAVKLADQDGVDFSQYDFNNDGYIDNIFVYYAGRSEAEGGSTDCVWPHKWNVLNKSTYDGKILDVYACTSELRGSDADDAIICGIGTFCHEFSHVFGLADHYDTTGSANGTCYGLGYYDLMTLGGYNNDGNSPPLLNALERMMIGWVEPEEIDEFGSITMEPINSDQVYKMSTDTEGEFFLFENRNRSSSVWDYYIPGEGLMITHVDQSEPYVSYWNNNYPNGDSSHECFRFIVAGNVSLDYYTGWDKVAYPYVDTWTVANNNDEWSPNSQPRAQSWSGEVMPLQLTDIAKEGQNITFNVSEAKIIPLSGTVKNSYGSFIANATLDLTAEGGSPSFAGVSDENGSIDFFDAEIPNGTYTLTVTAEGYATYTKTFDLIQGTIINVTLYSEAQGEMREVKYHNGEFDHAVGSADQIRPMAIMTEEMLKPHIGCSIKEVRFYAAAAFEGQIIIQPMVDGNYSGGWSPGSIEITDADLGWCTADFSGLSSTGGDIMIEPGTDYHVKIMVISGTDANPAIGLDNSTDRDLYSLSSLIDISGASPTTIYDYSGIDGNILVSLGLSAESSYSTPTSFSTNPAYADGISLSVNEKLELVWAAVPANGNPACDWSSSDDSVVTVSGDGTLLALSDGTATITGTSVLDSEVYMVYTINVSTKEARAKGRAVKFNTEEGIADITLNFYQIAASLAPKAETSALAALYSSVKSDVSKIDVNKFNVSRIDEQEELLSVTTDSNGEYQISGLTAGSQYRITVEQDAYNDPWLSSSSTTYNTMVAYDANDAETTINDLGNFELFTNSVYGADRFSYYDGTPELTSVGDATAATMYAIRIPASDLADKVGYEISHVDACVYNLLDSYMEIIIFTLDENGQLIFQGGTGYGDESTVFASGQVIFEFVNQDPIVIRPETDYYATVKMMGEIGAQTASSSANNGNSNLIWDDATSKFVTYKDLGFSEDFDWQISMFTKFREIDPVSSITVSAADTSITPCVGIEYSLLAAVLPTTATYSDVEWSSSDEQIATIDNNGVAKLIGEGRVTFTATSVTYPSVKGDYSVSVMLNQGTEGTVIDSDGNLVSGAALTFYPISYISSTEGAMQQISYTRTSESGLTTNSNSSGQFYIDLDPGTYEVEAKCSGLMDYQGIVTIEYGLNNNQIMMYQYIETLSDFMCYTTPQISSSIGDLSYNFVPYTLWTSEDLEGQIGKNITRLKALVAGAANIRFVVFTPAADEYIYRSDLIEIEDGALEMAIHDIPIESYITIEEGVEYCIGYEVSDYDEELAPAILSEAEPTITGKSDCVVYRGELTDLTTLASGYTMGSWVIGFYVQDSEQLKGLNTTVGQHDAVISWNPTTYDEFRLTYSVEGGRSEFVLLSDCQYEFSDLEPATTYTIKVEGKDGFLSYTELFSSSFTTLDQKTLIPLVQLKAYNGYKAGEILNLKTLNTQSTDDVEWYVNSEKLTRNTVLLEAGNHKIQCRVTRGSQVFVTTRYINVEQ